MLMLTVAVFVDCRPSASVTTSENVRVSPANGTDGAVNVGETTVVLDSKTVVPAVWDHRNDVTVPSESDDPVPSSVTVAPSLTF